MDRGGREIGASVAQAAAQPAAVAHQARAAHTQAAGGPQRSQGQVGGAADHRIGAGVERQGAHAQGGDLQRGGIAADAALRRPQFNRSNGIGDACAASGLGQAGGRQIHQAIRVDPIDREGGGALQAQAIGAGPQIPAQIHRQGSLQPQGHPLQFAGIGDQGAQREHTGVGHGAGGRSAAVIQGDPAEAVAVVLKAEIDRTGRPLVAIQPVEGRRLHQHPIPREQRGAVIGDHIVGGQADAGIRGGNIGRRAGGGRKQLPQAGVAEIEAGGGHFAERLGPQIAVKSAPAGVGRRHETAEAAGVAQVNGTAGRQGIGAQVFVHRIAPTADVRQGGATQQSRIGLRQLVETTVRDGNGDRVGGAAHIATHLESEVTGLNRSGEAQPNRGIGGGAAREQQGPHIALEGVIKSVATHPMSCQGCLAISLRAAVAEPDDRAVVAEGLQGVLQCSQPPLEGDDLARSLACSGQGIALGCAEAERY